jgi:uncharacterized protein (DUF302 family)
MSSEEDRSAEGRMTASARGVVTKASRRGVEETVRRLVQLLDERNLTIFSIIDHSGEAKNVGLEMYETKLVIFGSPAAGTPVMVASPLAALDLPLKVLVWADAKADVWVSYNSPAYLAERHHLTDDLRGRLDAIDAITDLLVESDH